MKISKTKHKSGEKLIKGNMEKSDQNSRDLSHSTIAASIPNSQFQGSKEIPTDEDREMKKTKLTAEFVKKELELKEKLILYDKEPWMKDLHLDDKSCSLLRIGGLDISFHKTKSNIACVSFVVLSFPKLEVLYQDSSEVEMDIPYIPSYLGHREVKHFQNKINQVRGTDYEPQIVLVDGNGLLHPRRFGSACLFGVTCSVPSVGVAKNLFKMPEEGIEYSKQDLREIHQDVNTWDITTNSGDVLAKAVVIPGIKKPVYVSIGNMCCLETAVKIVVSCSKFRIPEPIRQADMLSRKFLREKYKEDY